MTELTGRHIERQGTLAANSRLPQWELTWLNQEQCFYQHMCLVDSEVLRNPLLLAIPGTFSNIRFAHLTKSDREPRAIRLNEPTQYK